jgi:hypothetical protein
MEDDPRIWSSQTGAPVVSSLLVLAKITVPRMSSRESVPVC